MEAKKGDCVECRQVNDVWTNNDRPAFHLHEGTRQNLRTLEVRECKKRRNERSGNSRQKFALLGGGVGVEDLLKGPGWKKKREKNEILCPRLTELQQRKDSEKRRSLISLVRMWGPPQWRGSDKNRGSDENSFPGIAPLPWEDGQGEKNFGGSLGRSCIASRQRPKVYLGSSLRNVAKGKRGREES